MFRHINDITKLAETKEVKVLIETKVIKREFLNEKLRYEGDFEKTKRHFESLFKLLHLEGVRELIEAKVITPEFLNEKLRLEGDFEKVKHELINICNKPENKDKIKYIKDYKEAAIAGALEQGNISQKIPVELGRYTSIFLTAKDAAAAAKTSRGAAESARNESKGSKKKI